MASKIGVIVEGAIDYALVSALLERIAYDRASYDWPVHPDECADIIQIRKRGQGGVLEKVRALIGVLRNVVPDYDFFVVVLDQKTSSVQQKLRKMFPRQGFVFGIAIKEIEAWWLGDRLSTLGWLGLDADSIRHVRYSAKRYKAERDDNPKLTLDELTCLSDNLDFCYGDGNLRLAREFSETWKNSARLDDIEQQCPRGFGKFARKTASEFVRVKADKGRLF